MYLFVYQIQYPAGYTTYLRLDIWFRFVSLDVKIQISRYPVCGPEPKPDIRPVSYPVHHTIIDMNIKLRFQLPKGRRES